MRRLAFDLLILGLLAGLLLHTMRLQAQVARLEFDAGIQHFTVDAEYRDASWGWRVLALRRCVPALLPVEVTTEKVQPGFADALLGRVGL